MQTVLLRFSRPLRGLFVYQGGFDPSPELSGRGYFQESPFADL